jgi:hypothetical protein
MCFTFVPVPTILRILASEQFGFCGVGVDVGSRVGGEVGAVVGVEVGSDVGPGVGGRVIVDAGVIAVGGGVAESVIEGAGGSVVGSIGSFSMHLATAASSVSQSSTSIEKLHINREVSIAQAVYIIDEKLSLATSIKEFRWTNSYPHFCFICNFKT